MDERNYKIKYSAKNVFYKKYIQNGRFESDFVCLKNFIIEPNELISSTKALYYENLTKKVKQSVGAGKNLLVNSQDIL